MFIRSIWGYWRGTFPLVSCANTEALKRAGITRDTVSPVPSLVIQKDGNGDPTGVFIEQELAPIAEMIWFRDAARFSHADRLRALAAIGKLYHGVGTTSTFEGHGAANELIRVYRQAHHDGTLTMRSTLGVQRELAGGRRRAAWPVRRSLGRMARRARTRRRLAQDGRALRAGRARSRRRGARRGRHLHRLGRFQFQPRPAAGPLQGIAAALRRETTSARSPSPAAAGSACSIIYEEVDKQIPLKGRRWVVSHVNVISPRDIERIARMGLMLTTHTNAYLYKALETTAAGSSRSNTTTSCR